ncbi:MAG: nucleotidyltransferase domain-containing protein [Nanoarchaeota archaeon]
MYFWDKWNNKNFYEEKRILALIKIKDFLKDNYFDKIHSVFVGGSFQRREYTKNSDVDIWIIIDKDSNLDKIKLALKNECKAEIKLLKQEPNILSLESLKRGSYQNKIKNKMSPRRFVLLSHEFSLILGKSLPYHQLKEMTIKEAYEGMKKFILNSNLETFTNKEVNKLYLYLLYYKYKMKKKNLVYSFKSMKSIMKEEKTRTR